MNNNLRPCVRSMYKIQNLRIKLGLQIIALTKNTYPQVEQEIKDKKLDSKKLMRMLIKEFKQYELGEGSTNKYIVDDLFFILIQEYYNLLESEKRMNKIINRYIQQYPVYEYITSIRGCDDTTAAILLSEIDIRKATYTSSLYLLSGLDCGPDGKARNRSESHLVDRTYVDIDGKEKTKKLITYNKFLHDKVLGVIAPNLVRAKSDGYYDTYTNYKHRLDMRPHWSEKTKIHKHRAALRYMMRVFMANLYKAWRKAENLEVFVPYEVAKLGLNHWKRDFPISKSNATR